MTNKAHAVRTCCRYGRFKKYCGDKTIAFTIWQLGVPMLLTTPHTEPVDERMLQSCVEELVVWFFRWASEMERQMNDPERQEQQRLGGQAHGVSPLTAEDEDRKRLLQSVADDQRKGAKLAKKRDEKELSWDDMTSWQQQLVKRHDEEPDLNKRREPHRKKRHKMFEA